MQKFDKVLTCHDRKQKLYKSPEIFYEKFVKLTGHSHTLCFQQFDEFNGHTMTGNENLEEICLETKIVKLQTWTYFLAGFYYSEPLWAAAGGAALWSGGSMVFNASRIREETRPWPKYESQGAVESEDQLLFFAAAATKRLLPKAATTTKGQKLRRLLGHRRSYRSLVFYLFGLGAFAKARDTKPDIYISVTPIFTS